MTRFRIGDREYDFDGEYSVEEAMLFWDHAQIGMAELTPALTRWQPYVVATFMYILKKRAGEAVRLQDLKHMNVSDFAPVEEEPADEPKDNPSEGSEGGHAAADPTGDGGTTPEPDTTTT